MKQTDRERYYPSFDYDFEQTADQNYQVPEGYRWIRTDLLSRLLSGLIYSAALVFSTVYCRLFLHVRIRGSKKLRAAGKEGFFFYGNHTQPVGDVFNPALACFPRRIYTVVSPANLAIPVLGGVLPYLGALPTADTLSGMRSFNEAVRCRLEQGHPVIIYPEAHVWEYCSFIRPFSDTAFKLPVKWKKPVYSFTTTYQTRRFGKRPTATIYVDGPFEVGEGTSREQAAHLRQRVYECMRLRCEQYSNCSYIAYRQEP